MGRRSRRGEPAAGGTHATLVALVAVAAVASVASVALAALAPVALASGSTPKGTSSSSTASKGAKKKSTTTHPAAPSLARTGPIGFWECSSKTTELLVVVNTLTLHPGATLDVSFTVKNLGKASCNYTAPYAGVEPGPTSTSLQAGPCGSIGFQVENSDHHNVWPGTQLVNCPALGFARLAPGATVSGTGAWDQTKPNSYTLVVSDTHMTFPLHVAKS
jgi:hypothetical protein